MLMGESFQEWTGKKDRVKNLCTMTNSSYQCYITEVMYFNLL